MPFVDTIREELTSERKNLMVCNRGEIAIRIFRSAHELALHTIAVYSHEDRLSMHRQKADEAYQIGKPKEFTPVGAYLAIDEIIKIAKATNTNFIHPGYGFLSENANFAKKVEENNIIFIGPTHNTISKLGDKTEARKIAIECKVPVVPGSKGPVVSVEEIQKFVESYGLPIIIKAAMGGGGRGMRIVRKKEDIEDSFSRAKSEALASFGDDTMFVEKFLDRPRHIEIQILCDNYGNCIHLFERDCSVQRRHQKVVEIAPAKNLDQKVRQNLFNDALKLAKHVNYRNAGTVEFLVCKNEYYFIEINPRIQVEHTITEEITGIDIVSAQIQIAAGASLNDLGLTQDKINIRGFAIQCRVTTEDPENNFQPDSGTIEVYRSAGGKGIRLDGGMGFQGAKIQPYYDSLLVKVTCLGNTFEISRRKTLRALTEFRIRGIKTNLQFLMRLLTFDTFVNKNTWTTMIDDTPELFNLLISKNRAQKILNYLADLAVNGSSIVGQSGSSECKIDPIVLPIIDSNGECVDVSKPCEIGWRKTLLDKGPEEFCKLIRAHKKALITDTTWRDAHQSLLATRVRTIDMIKIAKETSYVLKNAFSIEMWGGATFDVSMRFLNECPWDRLRKLRELVPNIPFQMLLRGANAVGYTSYPDNLIYEFCKKARENGVDIFRVFDSLNYIENMRLGIDAVKKANGVVEATICYTGDITDKRKTKHTLEYYLNLTKELVDCGIHILGIKDMAGLLKPKAAKSLVSEIRKKYPDLPIHVHTHDTAGTGVASMLQCLENGADIVDVAIDSMSGVTSQPSMGAVVAGLKNTDLEIDVSQNDINILNNYWQQIRLLYSCFDPNIKSSDSSVYEHEMPGGQYTNLLFQSKQLGLGSQWIEIKKAYREANLLCGDIVKVTPSSKVVGDLAQFMVSNNLTTCEEVKKKAEELSFPTSVIEYFQGYLGQPYGGFDEDLRKKIIKNKEKIDKRPGLNLQPIKFEEILKDLTQRFGPHIKETDVISYALYPKVFEEFQNNYLKYGDVSLLKTKDFLNKPIPKEEIIIEIQKGKSLLINLLAISQKSLNKREVFFLLNGETRTVTTTDTTPSVTENNTTQLSNVQADKNNKDHVASPMSGTIVEMNFKENDKVNKDDTICVLSAMKMETNVTAQKNGIIKFKVNKNDTVSQGELIAVIEDEKQ